MNKIYKIFIEHEKICSDTFLKDMQIFDDRFVEEDYLFLSPLMDSIPTEKILEIIDDILSKEKIDCSLRLLILGDFLFSMTSQELSDPANMLFKTTRNEYLSKIRFRSVINFYLNCDFDYLKIHKKLLIGLRINNIIERSEIRTLSGDKWETIIYFSLKYENVVLGYNNPIGICKFPFVLINLHSNKYSVGSFRNIWKTKRKKREMSDVVVSYQGIIRANQIKFKISSELYNINKKHIQEEEDNLLLEANCLTISEYFTKIEKIIRDKSYAYKLTKGWEKIYNTTYKEIFILDVQIRKEYRKIMKDFQKIMTISLLKNKKFDEIFYLPAFVDNRGRQYYGTLISPTFYTIFRFLYSFGEKKSFKNLESSIFYNKIMKYKETIKKFNLNEKNSYMLIVLFIEVGKFFIKGSENFMIKTEDIIEKGITNFEIRNINLEIDDKLYLEKIYYSIENLLKDNIDEDTIVFKDATASGLQNYGLLLKYKEEKLKYLNIDNNDWCDTYQYIIDLFLEKEDKKFLKRKYWKQTIMTIPYNAEWYPCLITFIKALIKDGIDYYSLELEEKSKIHIMHKKFYEKVKNTIKKEFYENTNTGLKMFEYNKWTIVNKKEYKINYNKGRDKYTDTLYMINEDKEATEKGLEANNMHYLDAILIREILSKIEILPIHDCFGIRLCELHTVMDMINKYYSEKIGIHTYSIHIII